MKYTKPVILKKTAVNGAVCGNGSPCGRPCRVRELNWKCGLSVEKGAALLCPFINYMIEKYICMYFLESIID